MDLKENIKERKKERKRERKTIELKNLNNSLSIQAKVLRNRNGKKVAFLPSKSSQKNFLRRRH